MSGLIAIHVGLVIVAFLAVLNGYSSSSRNRGLDIVLGCALIVLLTLTFAHYGFWQGVLAVCGRVGYGFAFKAGTRRASIPSLGHRIGLLPEEPALGSEFVEGHVSLDAFLKGLQSEG